MVVATVKDIVNSLNCQTIPSTGLIGIISTNFVDDIATTKCRRTPIVVVVPTGDAQVRDVVFDAEPDG